MDEKDEKKEPYDTPMLEIVHFSAEDIITTSGGNDTPFEPCDWEEEY